MRYPKAIAMMLLAAMSLPGFAQVFNASADGKNTVIVDGASVGLDITQTSLNFGYNNYFSNPTKKSRFLGGVSVSGKNASGITNLFSSGHIVPESNLTGLIGFSHSNMKGIPVRTSYYQTQARKQGELSVQYRSQLVRVTDSISTAEVKAVFEKFVFRDSLLVDSLEKLGRNLMVKKEVRDDANTSLTRLLRIYKAYYLPADVLGRTLQTLNEQSPKGRYWRVVGYTDFGINSSSFRFLKSLDTTNFAKSITKEKFRGGFVGAGFNVQIGGALIIGLKYSYMETNNTGALEFTKYTLETTQTNATQTLKTETVIEAYGPGYKRYAQHQFAGDLMFIKPVSDSLNFIFDLYGKYNQRSNDTIRSLNIGVSWFMFKPQGRFIGGLYVELPDALGQLEEYLPIEDQRDWINRISFGVVARFSITTMGSYFYGKQ